MLNIDNIYAELASLFFSNVKDVAIPKGIRRNFRFGMQYDRF